MQDETNNIPIGDVEAAVEGLFGLIYLHPSDYFIVIGSLSLFALYGLSIYAGIKWIQKKFR
ncbi:hypothetical protein [uncultured Salegentibacter sp.]|jgi:hypothetical protein|uniref:hypothetical protein n=1 Tax=uncultured Salegentibacter sp. TaxID=259320 RepID=UPI0030D85BA2|tara:strand:- start:598 stop:780 length:183 start_codon:yes stop_codon:yes gene_type:complete